ncbi:ABC transporter substrate-binding protein [Alkalihalobacillus trypoxylicola]|uniref:Solute-binding protein family 5 domain-containing protein n=1 Tax=Alkalihalobacillus trypoxylicola TaxID=519424 RepID=A0A162DG97_9BACI|nr:ABC transporter substrate-binding protein [Alkalihalobacillus trypoxylicola]KYG29526.1 hypothetical protein AZF04_08375 [Alkalihalobacillus trypoxylicola]
MKKHYFSKIIALIASVGLLAACGSNDTNTEESPSGVDSNNSQMVMAQVNPPLTFNTINGGDAASKFVQAFMFDSLLDMQEPLEFLPKLADSFETEDNQTFTISLNQDAVWSDGTPITSDDFLFTLNRAADKEVESQIGSYIAVLEGVDDNGKLPEGESDIPSLVKVDEHTFTFTTKQPVDPNLVKEQIGVNVMLLPKHILEDVEKSELSEHPFMLNPTVTSGPFSFEDYKRDQYIQFSANSDYYRGAPELATLYIELMSGSNFAVRIESGEVQMNASASIGKIPVQDYSRIEGLDHIETSLEPNLGFQTMMFNHNTVEDPNVRQAIAKAINREYLVDELLQGTGEVIDGPYTSFHPYFNEDLDIIGYDKEEAASLLESSDWDRPLQLLVPTGNQIREQSANIVAENLREAGFEVEISTFDFSTIMQRANAGDFDLMLMGFTFTLDPDYSSLLGVEGPYNFMNYDSTKSEDLLVAGRLADNAEDRLQIYNELQEVWQDELPFITLYSDFDFAAVSKDVTFGGPRPLGMHYDLNKWSVTGPQ